MRKNPETGVYSGYYRLVESYRNEDGRVCHRTMVNAEYLDDLNADQLVIIQKLITEKAENCNNPLFTYQESDDSLVNKYVDEFYDILVAKKKIDIVSKTNKKQQANKGKDIQNIDVNSIKNKDVREIGSEWMCHQALEQLQFGGFLEKQGWSDHDINLAKTHLISRAVYPASELKTSKWIKENSSVCEITGTDIGKVTKDKLYRISNKLYEVKEALETTFLSEPTNYSTLRTKSYCTILPILILKDEKNTAV